jgi:hypothetical protein
MGILREEARERWAVRQSLLHDRQINLRIYAGKEKSAVDVGTTDGNGQFPASVPDKLDQTHDEIQSGGINHLGGSQVQFERLPSKRGELVAVQKPEDTLLQ